MGVRAGIAVLCLIGLYASAFMLRKYERARGGGLTEPSVVTSSRARVGLVPNASVGLIFYAIMLALTPLLTPVHHFALTAALIACALASVASLYLAYSLLFVTRLPCVYCWTGHVINWTLLALVIWIYRTPQ